MTEEMLDRFERLIARLERMNLGEYLWYAQDRRRLLRLNLLMGLARGLGGAIGFTVLGAIVIAIIRHIMVSNIPVIGTFLAEIATIVEESMRK